MTATRGAWNEAGQSEGPAIDLLKKLGYTYESSETLDAERESLRDAVLVSRLQVALRRLNPWLSDDNLHRTVRAVTSAQGASLIEVNEAVYTALTFGIGLEQVLHGGGDFRSTLLGCRRLLDGDFSFGVEPAERRGGGRTHGRPRVGE